MKSGGNVNKIFCCFVVFVLFIVNIWLLVLKI